MASFVFKWPHPNADEVYVTGTFDDWGKTSKLDKVGEFWEKEVDLPASDQKYLYKFVVNGDWVTDPTAPKEDDGNFNVNNVLYPEHITKKSAPDASAAVISSAVPDSTTANLAGQQPLEQKGSDLPGAFPETPANEPDTFGVQPIPASSGIGNPQSGDVQAKSVQDTVTTSKEDYEKAGSSAPGLEPETFSVQPIPASSGMGNPQPGDVQAKSVQDTVTTSKEDYEKAGSSGLPIFGGVVAAAGAGAAALGSVFSKGDGKKNLIPESSLPMGDKADKTFDAGPAIQSSGPTSTSAGLAAGVPLEQKRQAMVIDPEDAPSSEPAQDVPGVVKESLAESHQSPEAATSEEAVKEKEAVEKELLRKVPATDGAGESAPTTTAATSETAPAPTEASPAVTGQTPGQSKSAAAAIADGAGEEGEVAAPKHTTAAEKTEADNTEYAPPHTQKSAPGVAPGAAAAVSDGTEDPTLADEPAVKMMNQNEGGLAAEKPLEEAKPQASAPAATGPTTSAAPKAETPSKPTTTMAPTSAASKGTEDTSTTSTPTKDKKKKNRVSAFFKKIFD